MQVILDSSFARPGSAPIWAGRKESSGTGLSEVELEELERPLTKEKCFETLKLTSKGKCPGSDGFTIEFYLHFWSILGEDMVQSFN